jgi:hypothetical protein
MKTSLTFVLCLFIGMIWAQEPNNKEIKTEVSDVTVFIDGAQVTRKKAVDVEAGKTTLKFTNLSPFIDAQSIQVKAHGEAMVLSVNHQQNFLDKSAKSKELSDLEEKLTALNEDLNLENTFLEIIKSELSFLESNKSVTGSTESLNINTLKEASIFYGSKIKELKLQEIARRKSIDALLSKISDYQNQMNTLTTKKEYPTGEIWVSVESTSNKKIQFELSYLVDNVSWFPTYDIRAKDISQPIELVYKANVKQDCKEDWKNVKLTFSSSDPNRTGVAPELQTYFLGYNMRPPSYKRNSNVVSGRIIDSGNQPIIGATIIIEGTTIGTISDENGNYSITLPAPNSRISFSFIGFTTQTLTPTGSTLNVVLNESNIELNDVVVTGYGSNKSRNSVDMALQGRVAGVSVQKEKMMIRETSSLPVPSVQVQKQTTVNFEIKTPYTIPSDNKNYTVDMEVYQLTANFQYYCVPKVDRDAFLVAHLTNWEQYNLLEGEANIFFEGTYVGKSLLNLTNATDTLQLSLGRDKQVSVTREKVKDFTTKQFIGNKKEENRAWKTTVRNNKNQPINMILLDQVPISTLEEIEVSVQNASAGKRNNETGEIKWEFKLEPSAKQEFELRYSVKYPKNKQIYIE